MHRLNSSHIYQARPHAGTGPGKNLGPDFQVFTAYLGTLGNELGSRTDCEKCHRAVMRSQWRKGTTANWRRLCEEELTRELALVGGEEL